MFVPIQTDRSESLRNLSGLSDTDTAAIVDGRELDPRNTIFKRLLYRTGTVDSSVLAAWSSRSKDISISSISDSPNQYRFFPFSISAEAISVERFDYSKEDAKDFLRGFYILRCSTTDDQPFAVISRSTVSSWPINVPVDSPQQIKFSGFFLGNLKVGNADPNTNVPVFVARRFEWFPAEVNNDMGVDANMVALAQAGVDIALLDTVKAQKGKPIGIREATCFWQLLSACTKVAPQGDKRVNFATMLREPLESVGKAAAVQGRIRQCVPVKVTSPEAMELLGTDTWYQFTIFPDLDGRPIQVATRKGDPEVYTSAFPITVCTLELPRGVTAESIVGSSYFFEGFFYRIWSYPSERTEDSNLEGQPSPLMMVSTMSLIESTTDQLQMFLIALLTSVVIAVAAIGWFVLKTRKSTTRKELPETIEKW
jgi:hypothetical protein